MQRGQEAAFSARHSFTPRRSRPGTPMGTRKSSSLADHDRNQAADVSDMAVAVAASAQAVGSWPRYAISGIGQLDMLAYRRSPT
jgi:hypothetical protein